MNHAIATILSPSHYPSPEESNPMNPFFRKTVHHLYAYYWRILEFFSEQIAQVTTNQIDCDRFDT